ncbi:uncharacterized protein LOC141855152 [Brevipalpus obovatus]|uniref:uncharacterized protein LOC141855152 n=1 Tax=Brevipalpus obovatus TaxID=246614 RepID=UPI003D9DFBF2
MFDILSSQSYFCSSKMMAKMMYLLIFLFGILINQVLAHSFDDTQQMYINQPIRPLSSYQDITIFRFIIPELMMTANWNLRPNISTSNCDVKDIKFVLRWKAYPLISLQAGELNKNRHDVLLDFREQYEVKISDLHRSTSFSINNPLPGVWFAFAYYKPPANHPRTFKKPGLGLFEQCTVNLSTHLSFIPISVSQRPINLLVNVEKPSLLNSMATESQTSHNEYHHQLITRQNFKFYLPIETNSAKLILKRILPQASVNVSSDGDKTNEPNSGDGGNDPQPSGSSSKWFVRIYFRISSPPLEDKYDSFVDCGGENGDKAKCVVDNLNITRNDWNYILLVNKNHLKSFYGGTHGDGYPAVNVSLMLNTTECFQYSQSNLFMSSSTMDNLNSIDDSDSQYDPAIFSSFMKRKRSSDTSQQSSSISKSSEDQFYTPQQLPLISSSPSPPKNIHHEPECPSIVELIRYSYNGPFNFKYDYRGDTSGNHDQTIASLTTLTQFDIEKWSKKVNASQYFEVPTRMMMNILNGNTFGFGDPLTIQNNQDPTISSGDNDDGVQSTSILGSSSPPDSVLSFQIFPFLDSGGSLTLNLSLFEQHEHHTIDPSNNNVSVTACVQYGYYSSQYQQRLLKGQCCLHQIKVNSSHSPGASIRIPYPRAGRWYISFRSECYQVVGSDGSQFISTECKYNMTKIIFTVRSYACSDKDCGRHGKCHLITRDGLTLSMCSCTSGWKGLDCEDNSTALDEQEIFLQFLLLTVSNIVFIPVLILALYRQLFTEAFLYLIASIFSVLRHTCDTDSEYSFCIVDGDILRYIDYYSMLLAFWVTLISLSRVPERLKTFLHLIGSGCLAIALQYDKLSILTLIISVSTGFIIVMITWCSICTVRRMCFPSYQIWYLSMVPGLILTTTGLVAHTIFETRDYYTIVHSFWHVVMASALLFLVPTMEKKVETEEEEDYRIKAPGQSNRLAQVEWKPHTSFKFLQDDIDML